MTRDIVYRDDFSATLKRGLSDAGIPESLLEASEPQVWAWVYFLVRNIPDSEDIFPRGRWATIQRIQDVLDVLAKETVENYARKVLDR